MLRKYIVIYCRYSTDMQRADSCADQERLCWFSVKWNWQGRRVCKPREVIVAIPRLRVPLPCYVTPG